MHLYTSQDIITAPAARLNPGEDRPFAVIDLGGMTYLAIGAPEEAYALRDAAQLAADLLSAAEGSAS
jgi:hypothetical protein